MPVVTKLSQSLFLFGLLSRQSIIKLLVPPRSCNTFVSLVLFDCIMATNHQQDDEASANEKKPAFNVSATASSTTTFINNDDDELEQKIRNKVLGSKYNLKSFVGTKVQYIANGSIDALSEKKMQYVNTVFQVNCKDVAKKNSLEEARSVTSNGSIDALSEKKMQYVNTVFQVNCKDVAKKNASEEARSIASNGSIDALREKKMQYVNTVFQVNCKDVAEKNALEEARSIASNSNSAVPLQTSLDMSKKQNLINELQSPAWGKNGKKNEGKKTKNDKYYDDDNNYEKLDGKQELAVALPVSEVDTHADSDDMFLPAAIEFDPDNKKSTDKEKKRYNYRKIIIITILANLIISSITVGVTIAIMKHHQKIAHGPLHPRLTIGILQFLQSQFPMDAYKFDDPTTSFAKAMDWMTYDDPQLLIPYQDKTFLQRFVLVHLYFQTSRTNNWNNCTEQTNHNNSNNNTLTSTTSKSSQNNDTEEQCPVYTYGKWVGLEEPILLAKKKIKLWMSQYNECDWFDNKCDSLGNIIKVSLVKKGLDGRFPNELNRLVFLKSLHLSVNNITGNLPQQSTGSMQFKYLDELSLAKNQLQGDVPIVLYQNSRLLHHIYFEYNQFNEINFNYLPTDVKEIRFDGSNYSQPLVDIQIERLPSLGMIDMANTNVVGQIPLSLWNLPLISSIELSQNSITGRLPERPVPAILRLLQLEMNQITGPIPDAFVSSKSNILDIMLLSDNKLEGLIPPNITNLKLLFSLSLDNNKDLVGTIPTEMGKLSSLMKVSFAGTSVNKSIPIELCNLRVLSLSSIKADCLVDKRTGVSQISCPDGCCTTCCNADGKECVDY